MPCQELTTYRISLFGVPGAGKSSLVDRLVLDTFGYHYDPTLEDHCRKVATIDGKQCVLEFIEFVDDEYTTAFRRQTLNHSDAALLVYSIASKGSFLRLAYFHKFIRELKEEEGMWDPFQICVLGNKNDLKEREVPADIARDYAKKLGCAFEECSAKTGENVEKASYDLVRKIMTYRDNERIRYEQIQDRILEAKEKKVNRKSLWRKVFK